MMPGIGFFETILLVLVAVVVVGPKDLPLMMRKFGRFTGKMRAMAFEFKQGIDELGRQAELEELRKEVADLKKSTGLEEIERDFNEDARKVESDVNKALTAPSHPAASANGAAPAPPPAPAYAGLSADHPGYDAGDDFRIDGHAPQSAPSDDVHVVPDPETPDPEAAATPEQAQFDFAEPEPARPESHRPESPRPESAKAEPPKPSPAKQDAPA